MYPLSTLATALVTTLTAVAALPQTLTYFRVAGIRGGITSGSDGNLWFPTSQGIAKMTTAGQITMYATSAPISGSPRIAEGTDGRMWFPQWSPPRLVAITKDGTLTEYPLPSDLVPQGITGGSDGHIWFGYHEGGDSAGVGKITPQGIVAFFPLDRRVEVIDIVEGPDGNFWFVEYPTNVIGRITPAGVITHFPTYPPACCGPVSIARSDDGGLWLAFNQGAALARLSVDGLVTVHETPGAEPNVVESGPDGAMWYGATLYGPGATPRIGRVTIGGSNSAVDLITSIPMVLDIAAGSDGNVWATLSPPPYLCTIFCPPPDPTPPLGIARVNLRTSGRRRAVNH